jgi:hypothetical protein
MADLDRGAYTPPTDGGLAFDPRAPHRRRPLPITLILSVSILLVLIAALVFLYRAGTRGEGGEPQPVGEAVGPVREAPSADAQPVDPASSLDVYTDDVEPGAPVFTAPPEAPLARPAPAPTGTTGLADPAPAPAPRSPVIQPAPVPTPIPARPAAPAVAIPPAAARPAPTPPAARPAPPPPQPNAAAPAATGGAVSAQIGAFNTRAQAEAALARTPGGSGQRIEEVDRNGTTLYRAIATGFPSRAAAQAYCAGVSGGCIIR